MKNRNKPPAEEPHVGAISTDVYRRRVLEMIPEHILEKAEKKARRRLPLKPKRNVPKKALHLRDICRDGRYQTLKPI